MPTIQIADKPTLDEVLTIVKGGGKYSSLKVGTGGTAAESPTTISGKGRIVLRTTGNTSMNVKLNGASSFTSITTRADAPFELFFNTSISFYGTGVYYVAQLV